MRPPDGVSRNQFDYIIAKRRQRSSIIASKTWPGTNCGTDLELLLCKLQVKLKEEEEIQSVSKIQS